jgi:hypothetical protein
MLLRVRTILAMCLFALTFSGPQIASNLPVHGIPLYAQESSAVSPAIQSAYQDIVKQEHQAIELTLSLDSQMNKNQSGDLSQKIADINKEDEGKLFGLDTAIDDSLKDLYAQISLEDAPENNKLLSRTALLHWTILLRRKSMQGFHTIVPGLEDSPICAGDVIGDQLLLKYFDALFEDDAPQSAALQSLLPLAKQSACLGTQQSALFASDLYWSFTELQGFLNTNGLNRTLSSVVLAAANPLLLFYDVEKYRGASSPLARWFSEHYAILADGVASRRIPASWQGLWLYDRVTGRLIGYHVTAQPKDENDVDLAVLLASITQRENLGQYACSFREMVERGATAIGYVCGGTICAQNTTTPAERLSARNLGLSLNVIESTVCQQSSGSGGSGGNNGGGGLCGNGGLSLPGGNRAADTVKCISAQAVQPGEKMLSCMAEATGKCSNPVDKAVKDLQQVGMAGVPLGKNCTVSADGGTPDAGTPGTGKHNDINYDPKTDKLSVGGEPGSRVSTSFPPGPDKTTITYSDGSKAEVEVKRDSEGKVETIVRTDTSADGKQTTTSVYDKNTTGTGSNGGTNGGTNGGKKDAGLCVADSPQCGNSCTAMSEQMQQVMQCMQLDTKPEDVDPLKGNGGVIDPIEPTPDPRSQALLACMGSVENQVTLQVQRSCWAAHCANNQYSMTNTLGQCVCTPPPTGGPAAGNTLANSCSLLRCSEDSTPTMGPGGCACQAIGGIATGPIPKPPISVPGAETFSDIRFGLDIPH